MQLGPFFHSMLKAAVLTMCLLAPGFAQNNPIPQIVGPVHPMAVAPGSGAFTLNVYGANFVPGAVVSWNYEPRATTFVSAHELQARILASDVANNTAGFISAANPAPGGGDSSASWAQVEVHQPAPTIQMSTPKQYYFGDYMMSVADFNHDGVLDLVGEYGTHLGFEEGLGNGQFQHKSIVGRNYLESTEFAYGDFNGDGNLDVALVNGVLFGQNPTHLSIRLGDGKGTFSAGPTLTSYSGDLNVGIVVGDFNQDGKLDLVTSGYTTLSEFLGNGDGTFQHPANYAYSFADAVVVGDFNGDGKLDLVFMESGTSLTLWFLPGLGDGTFGALQEIGSYPGGSGCGGSFQVDLQLSDFNGDGKLDLAFCNQSQIGVLLGNGDGSFQAPVYYTADSTDLGLFTFSVGDINSDGKPDLVVSKFSNFNPMFVTFLGNGNGTFQPDQTVAVGISGAETGIIMGDIDSNGLLDAMFLDGGAGVYVFLQH